MSDKYKKYLEQKRPLEEKQVDILKMLTDCQEEMKILHMQYIKSCDHPTKFSQSHICSICYSIVRQIIEPVVPIVYVETVEPVASIVPVGIVSLDDPVLPVEPVVHVLPVVPVEK